MPMRFAYEIQIHMKAMKWLLCNWTTVGGTMGTLEVEKRNRKSNRMAFSRTIRYCVCTAFLHCVKDSIPFNSNEFCKCEPKWGNNEPHYYEYNYDHHHHHRQLITIHNKISKVINITVTFADLDLAFASTSIHSFSFFVSSDLSKPTQSAVLWMSTRRPTNFPWLNNVHGYVSPILVRLRSVVVARGQNGKIATTNLKKPQSLRRECRARITCRAQSRTIVDGVLCPLLPQQHTLNSSIFVTK